jgi:hypothetical protein
MIISHEHEFIFVKTRKTAGSSMEIALSKYLGDKDVITPCMPVEEETVRRDLGFRGAQNFGLPLKNWKFRDYLDYATGHQPKRFSAHASAQLISNHLEPEKFRRYRKILTVRNPYTYVVSLYNWHARKLGPSIEGFQSWLTHGQGDLRFSNYAMGKVDGNFVMDLVLQFETIVDGARNIASQLGLPNDFAKVFESITVKSSYEYPPLTLAQAYESVPQARSLVESRFHEEIRRFNYEFPL